MTDAVQLSWAISFNNFSAASRHFFQSLIFIWQFLLSNFKKLKLWIFSIILHLLKLSTLGVYAWIHSLFCRLRQTKLGYGNEATAQCLV